MKPAHRKFALIAALAGVGLLAWFAPEPAPVPVTARERGASSQTKPTVTPVPQQNSKEAAANISVPLVLPDREPFAKARQDLFGPQSWLPPPPKPEPAPPPPPPPPPVAPPNPYRFAGRFIQDGQAQVFLTKGDFPVQIKVGDFLDGSYRIESIAGTSISMTYVPLGLRENIPIPVGNDSGAGLAPALAPGTLQQRPLVLSPESNAPLRIPNRAP